MFEVERKRECNRIERAVRLTTAREIDMCNAIGKGEFAVAVETIEHEGESLIAFDIAWTFEIFIEHGTD